MKKILFYLGEIILGLLIWCLLDYFFYHEIDLINNLFSVTIITVLSNLFHTMHKKKKEI